MSAYSPPLLRSSWWVPSSATSPKCRTAIMLASTMVDSRCATIRVVRAFRREWSATWILRSVRVSSALVASSNTRMCGFFNRALAKATRCFSPPLNRSPRSPTTVS
mmetsp:Transcript_14164/g.38359  ORF Transcript_14164/g.38359 Transcript_14164/m.38359 type:complete len:106 (-) Transcript_14164:2219-2536(-)